MCAIRNIRRRHADDVWRTRWIGFGMKVARALPAFVQTLFDRLGVVRLRDFGSDCLFRRIEFDDADPATKGRGFNDDRGGLSAARTDERTCARIRIIRVNGIDMPSMARHLAAIPVEH